MLKYELDDPSRIDSPALLYYVDAIRDNIGRAVQIAGGPDRLWPHIKTHKIAEIVRMQQKAGITRFKCATVAEAEMLGECGAREILLAYPLVGPAVGRFIRLMRKFPDSGWWTIGDCDAALNELDKQAGAAGLIPNVLIDVNMGMDRTGAPLAGLADFYMGQASRANLRVRGFHCYDGHIHDSDISARRKRAAAAADRVFSIRDEVKARGFECDTIILGGTPTFPCHAGSDGAYLSPGTIFINDYGYQNAYADLPFEPAAAILARVISLPAPGLFTIDLGHKAVGADPSGPRGAIVSLPDAAPAAQSEEHRVFKLDGNDPRMPKIGDVLYVIPTHICPTTALYDEVLAVSGGRVTEVWKVAARNRKITI